MSIGQPQLEKIARDHGVDFEKVVPRTLSERLAKLGEILAIQSVPYPIQADKAKAYLEAAEEGRPFSVGRLGDFDPPDLGKYADTQIYDKYNQEEHLSWACLVADQQKSKGKYACREYLEGEHQFAIGELTIPDYYLLNARIYQQTRWQLATVKEIIPAELFFTCHCKRYFPVTTFMRALETGYLEEPDIGHDIAGHVATFTIPSVANVMKNHGDARNIIFDEWEAAHAAATSQQEEVQAARCRDELLSYAGRIYWFTVEFGLVMQGDECRAFGAGILSSPDETHFSIDAAEPNRILIDPGDDRDLLRLATTNYLIREFQKTYFVMESFDRLDTVTPERIVETAKLAMRLPHYTWNDIAAGERVLNRGVVAMDPNEKYRCLLDEKPTMLRSPNCSDYCVPSTAVRNLRMYAQGIERELFDHFRNPPPDVPEDILAAFVAQDVPGKYPPDIGDYEKKMGETKSDILEGEYQRTGYGIEMWPKPRPKNQ